MIPNVTYFGADDGKEIKSNGHIGHVGQPTLLSQKSEKYLHIACLSTMTNHSNNGETQISLKSLQILALTHLPLVPHTWVSESGQHWSK